MKFKLVLVSLALFPWGFFSQAWGQCTCSDKEAIAINQAYHQSQLAVTDSAQARFSHPSVISLATVSAAENRAMIKELDRLVIDAGLRPKSNAIEKGIQTRAAQTSLRFGTLTGTELERAYVDYILNESQLLLTVFDTYFILKVVTPTMKGWVKTNRAKIAEQHAIAKGVLEKL